MTSLTINGKTHDIDADPDTPLLWVLREWLGMTGTKYGCGIAQCGACTRARRRRRDALLRHAAVMNRGGGLRAAAALQHESR